MHYFILAQMNQLVYIHHTPEICYYFVTSHVTTTPYTLKLNLKLVHKPSNVENTLLILTCRVCDQLTLWRITTLLTTPYMFKRKRSKHTQRAYESVSIHTPCSWDLLLLYLQPHICKFCTINNYYKRKSTRQQYLYLNLGIHTYYYFIINPTYVSLEKEKS